MLKAYWQQETNPKYRHNAADASRDFSKRHLSTFQCKTAMCNFEWVHLHFSRTGQLRTVWLTVRAAAFMQKACEKQQIQHNLVESSTAASKSVCRCEGGLLAAGDTVQMMAVRELPPRLACSILVSLLSLKGT